MDEQARGQGSQHRFMDSSSHRLSHHEEAAKTRTKYCHHFRQQQRRHTCMEYVPRCSGKQ